MKITETILMSLFVFGAIIFASGSRANESEVKKRDHISIVILPEKSVFEVQDTIMVKVYGEIWNTGDCGHIPHFGILKQQDNGWDTLINIKKTHHVQVDCGSPYFFYSGHEIEISRNSLSFTMIDLTAGTYRLSVIDKDRKKVYYSQPFILK